MSDNLSRQLIRWTDAGVIDAATADRIRAFEESRAGSFTLRWPIWLALAFGGLMIGAGVLLFVSANWDTMSPLLRVATVLMSVALFHLAAIAVSGRFAGLASTLHAVGTVACGAGIFLCGQIFNLAEHWPSGLMLWTIGAALAWGLLRQWPQMALTAVLAPAWLMGEWWVAAGYTHGMASVTVPAAASFLLALVYFTAVDANERDVRRQTLLWLGGIALLPAAQTLVFASSWSPDGYAPTTPLAWNLRVIGWTVAVGAPLALAAVLRRVAAWPIAVAVVWVVVLLNLHAHVSSIALYAWWALGAAGLAAWGVHDARSERINMGSAILAATVLAFYSSEVMDKLGRSASLIGLGILCLAGGWALEQGRRRLVRQTRGGQS